MELISGSGVFLPISVIVQAEMDYRQKWEAAFKTLLLAMFLNNVLATHVCLGKRSQLPRLDAHKVATLKGKYQISLFIVFTCITSYNFFSATNLYLSTEYSPNVKKNLHGLAMAFCIHNVC